MRAACSRPLRQALSRFGFALRWYSNRRSLFAAPSCFASNRNRYHVNSCKLLFDLCCAVTNSTSCSTDSTEQLDKLGSLPGERASQLFRTARFVREETKLARGLIVRSLCCVRARARTRRTTMRRVAIAHEVQKGTQQRRLSLTGGWQTFFCDVGYRKTPAFDLLIRGGWWQDANCCCNYASRFFHPTQDKSCVFFARRVRCSADCGSDRAWGRTVILEADVRFEPDRTGVHACTPHCWENYDFKCIQSKWSFARFHC